MRERRWSNRRRFRFTARLDRVRPPSVSTLVRNLSIGGLFIETGLPVLDLNETVVVSFHVATGDGESGGRLPARVVWTAGHGAGLMFTDFCRDNVHLLRDLVHAADAPGGRAGVST